MTRLSTSRPAGPRARRPRPFRSGAGGASGPSVAVIGGGAIGGCVAAAVHDAGHPVTLCLRSPLTELVVESAGESRRIPVTTATEPALQAPVDWLLLATKAQDTLGAAGWLSRMADQDTTVVVLQNGVDHAERVAPLVPGSTTVLPALVYLAAERTGRGHIVHRAGGRLVVPDTTAGASFRTLLAPSDLTVDLDPDFTTARWRKLLSNLAANPLTALTLRRMEVLADADMAALARATLAEGAAVATAEGAHLAPDEVDRTMTFYAGFPADSGSSMLYDRLAGRPLEHELITGAVVRAADEHGIPVPVNRALLALLKAINTRTAP
jgi:2-dehydropantoate 2-reductase